MKSVKELLGFDYFDANAFVRRAPQPIKISQQALDNLNYIAQRGDTEHEPPNREDLRQIYHSFIAAHKIETLRTEFDSLRQIRQLAWVLTYSENGLPRIVDTSQLNDALQLIENRFSIRALLGVFDALLQAWDTPNAGMLRAFVKKYLIGYEGRRTPVRRLKGNIAWYCEENGAIQLAMNLLSSRGQLSEVWSYLELPDHTHSYSYFGAVAEEYIAHNRHLDQATVANVIKFVEIHSNDKTSLAILSKLIEGLGHEASEHLRQPVQSYVLREWGDPRITGRTAHWHSVSDEAKQIFTRWITREDLRFFFDAVARACNDQKFAYRKAFWLAYLEHISFCRPVLRRDAEYLFSNDPQTLQYYQERRPATLTSGDSSQHAFIIQMGNDTFVEFSTAGACYVYDDINRPFSLNDSTYSMFELRWRGREKHWQPHPGSERYLWQRKFASWLKSNLGIEPVRSYRLNDEALRPDTLIISCPNCRQRLRTPTLERRLRITCPRCHHTFEREVW